jgi:large subunit ribosomal protein L15
LQRVVPKSGFKNINRVEYKAINLDVLQQLAEKKKVTSIDLATLVEAGVASKNDKIKILGRGTLSTKLDVKAHAFSKSAKEVIEKLEGTTEIL